MGKIHTALRLHSDADVVSDEILTALEDLSKLDIKLRDIPSTVVELENVISEFAYVDNSGRGKSTVIVVDGLDDFDCSPTSLCNCLKKCADSCNAAVVLTAHGWRDSADVKNAMERCDAVLSIVQDEDECATELSIHKCRYSGPFYYGGHTVQLVFLPRNAKFYELSDVYQRHPRHRYGPSHEVARHLPPTARSRPKLRQQRNAARVRPLQQLRFTRRHHRDAGALGTRIW